MKRGRPSEQYLTWLCWLLASTVDAITGEFLPQHKQREGSIGAYASVGDLLHLSPDTVEYHCRKARALRATEEGMQDYAAWMTMRDRCLFFHHIGGIDTHLLHSPRGQADYKAWVTTYERSGRSKPFQYCSLSATDPVAIAIDEQRAASGLRNGLTKRGRPRK
jgi:hypothetical protein